MMMDILMNVNLNNNHHNQKLHNHMIQIIVFQLRRHVNVVEIVEYNHQLNHQVKQPQIMVIMISHKIQFQWKWKRKKKGKK